MRQDQIIQILNVAQILTAQEEGENAALDELGRRACPYPPGSVDNSPETQAQREMWLAGYRMGETRRRAVLDRELGLADPDEVPDEITATDVPQAGECLESSTS